MWYLVSHEIVILPRINVQLFLPTHGGNIEK